MATLRDPQFHSHRSGLSYSVIQSQSETHKKEHNMCGCVLFPQNILRRYPVNDKGIVKKNEKVRRENNEIEL